MKGLKKILVTAAVMIMCVSAVANAEGTTDSDLYFSENFDGWTSGKITEAVAAEKGYSGGSGQYNSNCVIAAGDADDNMKFGIKGGNNIQKNFDSLLSGMIGIEYDVTSSLSETDEKKVYNQGTMVLGFNMADGTDKEITITQSDYVTWYGFDRSGEWKYNSTEASLINHITAYVNTETDMFNIKFTDKTGAHRSFNLTLPAKVNSVKYFKILAHSNNMDYAYFDNINVYQRSVSALPELTYIDEDFSYGDTGFFSAYTDGYSKLKYYNISSANSMKDIDDFAKGFINFSENCLNVGYTVNENNRRYAALLPFSQELSGILDISFDARHGGNNNVAAYIDFICENKEIIGGIYIRPNSGENEAYDSMLCVNHEWGINNQYNTGAMIKKVDTAKPNHYRIVMDTINHVFDLYVDNKYYGAYAFSPIVETSESLVRIGFTNVIVDNLVVKKSELLREYSYDFVGNESVNPNRAFGSLAELAGKKPIVKLTISNPTKLDKNAVLISAIYDADGRLVSTAVSEQKSLTAELTSLEAAHSAALPVDSTGYFEKTFVFESLSNLKPMYEPLELK